MVNYLVAVDGSPFARAAFYTAALMMDRAKDKLFVLTVVEHVEATSHAFLMPTVQKQLQERVNRKGKELLKVYLRAADQLAVENSGILAISNHVGEMICNLAKSRNIETVVLGRRGMGTIQRFFLGSSSRYVIENAACNVLVIKEEWGPSSVHVPRKVVVEMEEKERQERVGKIQKEQEEEDQRRKFESNLNLNVTRLAEETERMLREKQDQPDHEKEEEDRFFQHIGVIEEEEIERQRRIEEKRQKDDEKHKLDVEQKIF